ncbi:MAG: phosphate-starvation-inducible PsiE family protein [Gammaproteobacteria bacterium]
MIRLVYMSNAVKPMSAKELMGLLKKAQANNSRRNITGVLLYANQTFVQVLEGEDSIVDRVFETIKKDSRHRGVKLIERVPIENREFPDWSMGFEELDPETAKKLGLTGANEFFSDSKQVGDIHKALLKPLMEQFKKAYEVSKSHDDLPLDIEDNLLSLFHKAIRFAVTVLAFLMVVVIFVGVADVVYVLYKKLISPPFLLLDITDILATFGAFLAVLIAIEIFINITLYLRTDVIPVKLVVATALMAIARKVIVFDYKYLDASYVYATAAVVLALGITYWLISKHHEGEH